jgi:hypothetical protein
VHDTTGLIQGFERFYSRPQNCHLSVVITGLAKGPPQRIFDGRQARHAHRAGQIRDGRKNNCGEAGRFDLALSQSNGPAADFSDRNQKDHVNLLLTQAFDDSRDRFLKHLLGAQQVPHDRIVAGRGAGNFT